MKCKGYDIASRTSMLKVTQTWHKKGWSCKKWNIPICLPPAVEARKMSIANEGLVPKMQLCAVKAKIYFTSLLMASAKEDKLGMSVNQLVLGSYHAHLQIQASFWAAEYGGGGRARSLSVPCRDLHEQASENVISEKQKYEANSAIF